MKRPHLRDNNKGPERIIQDQLITFLESRGWWVKETHGNLYQAGLPDLYCLHPKHRQRWIEVKNPEQYSFTNAQRESFPVISKAVGLWILVAATESEYAKLFHPPNWYKYLEVLK